MNASELMAVDRARQLVRSALPIDIPRVATLPPLPDVKATDRKRYRQIGLDLYRGNHVAILMLAGGLSTRLRDTSGRLRGDLPLGPVTERTLFQLQGAKVSALRERYAPNLVWLVMTSAEIHDETVTSFGRDNWYGFPRDRIIFFQQDSLPVLDLDGNPVHVGSHLITSPVGHGGMVGALACLKRQTPAALALLEGVEHVYHFQYPNALDPVFDPEMLGYHAECGCDVTTKVFFNTELGEPVGRVVASGQRAQVVEYHAFSNADKETLERWNNMPASAGIHFWSWDFLQGCIGSGLRLPHHVVRHHQSHGSDKPLQKIEYFAFDLMLHAQRSQVWVDSRDLCYAMVKEPSGINAPERTRHSLNRLYRQWLDSAGAVAGNDAAVVEVDPNWALCREEVIDHLPTGYVYNDGEVFCKERHMTCQTNA